MFPRHALAFLVLPILVGLGCSNGDTTADPPNPNIVASFSGGAITKDQLKAKYESLMPCCKDRYKGNEGAKTLIKEMVLPTVIAQRIKQNKIEFRGNIRDQLGKLSDELNMSFLHMKFHEQILNTDEKFKDLRERYEYQIKILKGYPLSERFTALTRLHENIHQEIAKEVEEVAREHIEKLRLEASITKNYDVLKVNVSGEELREFYRQHKEGLHADEYRVPERVRVQEIKIDEASDKEAGTGESSGVESGQNTRSRAESALNELRSGAEFRAVVEKYDSRRNGSMESKWYARGELDKELEDAVFTLDVGEISPVVKAGNAFHIVRVLEHQAGRLKAYEEVVDQIEREYRWQKGEDYLKENKDRILFTINAKPYTIGDFIERYEREVPDHECHHMKTEDKKAHEGKQTQLCDFAHNDFEEQEKLVDRMIDTELIVEDTYNQMIHVEHQKEIEFLTMASLYPIFHKEEMGKKIRITDEMVKEHYENNRDDYHYPAKAQISFIVSKGSNNEKEKKTALEKARKAYGEVKPSFLSFKRGKDFGEVARKYSDDPETASRGGRLEVDVYECRNQIEYMLLHGFHKKIFELEPGDISEIFKYGEDYYIVQIREMEKRKQLAFEEVKEHAKNELLEIEHQKVMVKWEEDLIQSADYLVYDRTLKEALAEGVLGEPEQTKGS